MFAGKKRLIGLWAGLQVLTLAGPARAQQPDRPEDGGSKERRAAASDAAHPLGPAELFEARAQLALGSGQALKGEWGILVADARTGQVLFEQNADKYFVPASNMKLLTTAFALAKLGPEFRFRTTLESLREPSPRGSVEGPLYLVGRGDPNLSNRKFPYVQKEEFDGPPERGLAGLADALAAKGVKEITGDIVGDDSYFPRDRYPSGWEIDDMVWEYGAALSSIVVDDNTVQLMLTPGAKVGDRVEALVTPTTPEFVVDNQVVTSAAGVKADLTLKREPGAGLVTVLGTLPARSTPRKLTLAIQEPALHAAAMLKRLLEDRGIRVDGAARELSLPPGPPAGESRVVLAEHLSIPLGESIKLVNKISQNLHTEMLLRAAARAGGPWTTPDELANLPAEFYAVAGIPAGDVVQADGSGLSRHDLVTPRALVALLLYAQKQPWFGPYYDSLPVAGVDGTLEDRMKNSIAAGRLRAKTGSVEHVRTRAGYAELPSGRRLVFSFMSNNMGTKGHEATDALDALSIAMIEEFDAAGGSCCRPTQ